MPLSPLATDRPLRVLSLASGGFLGLYTAVVLEALEARAGAPLRSARRHLDRRAARVGAGLRDTHGAPGAPFHRARVGGVFEPRTAQRCAEPTARPEPLGAAAQILRQSAARGLAGGNRRQTAGRRLASGGRARSRCGPVPDQGVQDAACTGLARRWPLARGRRGDGGMRGASLLSVGAHRSSYLRGWRLVRRRARSGGAARTRSFHGRRSGSGVDAVDRHRHRPLPSRRKECETTPVQSAGCPTAGRC